VECYTGQGWGRVRAGSHIGAGRPGIKYNEKEKNLAERQGYSLSSSITRATTDTYVASL